jgi:hypothetical protein
MAMFAERKRLREVEKAKGRSIREAERKAEAERKLQAKLERAQERSTERELKLKAREAEKEARVQQRQAEQVWSPPREGFPSNQGSFLDKTAGPCSHCLILAECPSSERKQQVRSVGSSGKCGCRRRRRCACGGA